MVRIQRVCRVCGDRITTLRRWSNAPGRFEFCSDVCRKRGLSVRDQEIEGAILRLLEERAAGVSICPSEVARALHANRSSDLFPDRSTDSAPDNRPANPAETADQVVDQFGAQWRAELEPVRLAARRLQRAGRIEILQQGRPIALGTAKGPVRLRLRPLAAVQF